MHSSLQFSQISFNPKISNLKKYIKEKYILQKLSKDRSISKLERDNQRNRRDHNRHQIGSNPQISI